MKVKVNKKEFSLELDKVGKAIKGDADNDFLRGVLLQAKGKALALLGSDTDTTVITGIFSEVFEEGSLLVEYKIFSEIIRKMPEGELTLEVENDVLSIIGGKAVFNLVLMDAEKYPQIPQLKEKKSNLTVNTDLFKKIISTVSFAVGTDDIRPALKGVYLEAEEGKLTATAMDGYRISTHTKEIDKSEGLFKVLIDGKAISDVNKILPTDTKLNISIFDNHCSFAFGSTQILIRLIDGIYPNYRSLIPEEFSGDITVSRIELISAIERVNIMSKNNAQSNLVLFNTEKEGMIDILRLISKNSNGKASEDISISLNGIEENFQIGFNSRYLVEALRQYTSSDIVIKLNSNIAPVVFKENNNDDYINLLLPVRVAGGAK